MIERDDGERDDIIKKGSIDFSEEKLTELIRMR